MSKISGNMNKTAVKVFSIICMTYYSPNLFAKTSSNESSKGEKSRMQECRDAATERGLDPKTTAFKNDVQDCLRAYEGKETTDPNKVNCNEIRREYKEAEQKIAEACRKAGLSESNCASNAKSCGEELEEDSLDTMGAIGTVLGLPMGSTQSQVASKCPQMNGRDYFTEKDKMEKEIKDTQKEIAELNDDKAKLQDDYNKQMQDIQETLTKAQEDYKKKEEDLNQEERERVAQFQESQNQANEAMRKKGDEIISLRGQLTQLLRNKARALGKLTESTGKLSCMAEVNKMKAEYEKLYSSNSSASANFIGQAKKKKQEMINTYNTCMADFNQQRIQLNETTQNQQETLEKKIADTQSSLDEIQNSLNLASTQFEEIKQATAKKKQNALQSVIDLGTRSQQQMQAAYTKLQENLKTLAAKQASLEAALNRTNQSLQTLGPVPKRGSEYSVATASSEISSQVNILRNIANNPDYTSCNLKESANKTIKKYDAGGAR